MKVAIVGSGISGLAAAHQLRGRAEITLLEAGSYFGGHTHTVDITLANAAGVPRSAYATDRSAIVDVGGYIDNRRQVASVVILVHGRHALGVCDDRRSDNEES